MNNETDIENPTLGDTFSINPLAENLEQDGNEPGKIGVGSLLGEHKNFRLEQSIGAGGMGEVWLAEEFQGEKLVRKVVCKILPHDIQKSEQMMKDIESVFKLTKDLNHENICPLYGMNFDQTCGWFFVMGYADGGTLTSWFNGHSGAKNGIPFKEVLEVLRPLASALDYAHENRVIHRDLKPDK